MTRTEIVARLRELARQKPTDVYKALLVLAIEIEQAGDDVDGPTARRLVAMALRRRRR